MDIDSLVGKLFAERYEILSLLGKGGIGVVYKARHLLMDRIVAVKILKPHYVVDEQSMKRFQQEAMTAAVLTHPHVIDVHDFGIAAEGTPYLVMDYLEGRSLSDVIKDEDHLDIERTLDIFSQACEGLAHAHKQGVIHRDMKPSNIMLVAHHDQKDFVKIVDFGMAKLLPGAGKEEQHLTATGEVMGSPLYMSPEQCMGKPLDARADIYSLGCAMYEALTGKPPVLGDNAYETMYKHMNDGPEPFEKSRPDLIIPMGLQKLVFKATEREPEKRFQNMEEMKDAIENVDLFSSGTFPPLAGLWKTKRRLQRRWSSLRLPVTLAAIGVVTLVGGLGLAIYSNNEVASSERNWSLLYQTALAQMDRNDFAAAEKTLQSALHQARAFGKTDRRLRNNLEKLAQLQRNLGKNEEAAKLQAELSDLFGERTTAANEEKLLKLKLAADNAKTDDERLAIYAQIRKLLLAQSEIDADEGGYSALSSRMNEAEEYARKAVELQRKRFAQSDERVAQHLMDLANVVEKRGRYREAIDLMSQARDLYGCAKDDERVANINLELADLYRRNGQADKGDELIKSSLAIYEKRHGRHTLPVAEALSDLGSHAIAQDNYKAAAPFVKEALEIRKELLPPEHVTLAESYRQSGTLSWDENKLDEAEAFTRKALEIDHHGNGESYQLASDYSLMAAIMQRRKRYDDAAQNYRSSLAILQKIYGPGHPEEAHSLRELANLYFVQNRYAEAEEWVKAALAADRKLKGEKSPLVAHSHIMYGIVLAETGRLPEADEEFRKGIAIDEKLYGTGSPKLSDDLIRYAVLLRKMGKQTEAAAIQQRVQQVGSVDPAPDAVP